MSQPGDAVEREADRLADRLVPRPSGDGATRRSPLAHAPRAAFEAVESPGRPLTGAEHRAAGRLLDPSDIRVHSGPRAVEATRSLEASAYSFGEQIVLGEGYVPGSASGLRLIAHEVAHVAQQRASAGSRAEAQLLRQGVPARGADDPRSSAASGAHVAGSSMQALDIALRDLYKAANVDRAAAARSLIAALSDADKAAVAARQVSELRNLLRAATQQKLTPIGRVLSSFLEKDRSWEKVIAAKGNPFDTSLPAGERLAIADRIAASSAKSSDAMNALQAFGKGLMILNVFMSGFEIGTGIREVFGGRKGEGIIDITEGTSSVTLTIGTYSGLQKGTITIAEGTGGATFITGLVAAGAVALGFEESRRTLRGEKTLAEGAVDYWKSVQQAQLDRVEREGHSVGGALKYVGARFGQVGAGVIYYPRKGLEHALEWAFGD